MYTDMHCHVIWGVDDGASHREETEQMLRDAAADGIGLLIATPHMTPGVYEFPEDRFLEHLAYARDYAARRGLPIRIARGAEILYTETTPRLLREGRVPTLAGTNYALIEFSPTDSWDHIRNALQKISGAGFAPVIAHMERYPAIRTTDQVRKLKNDFRALIQINSRSLLRKQPLLRRRYFDGLFREKLVDFVATDTHAIPGRETCMRESMNALSGKYGPEVSDFILQTTEQIFGNIPE